MASEYLNTDISWRVCRQKLYSKWKFSNISSVNGEAILYSMVYKSVKFSHSILDPHALKVHMDHSINWKFIRPLSKYQHISNDWNYFLSTKQLS